MWTRNGYSRAIEAFMWLSCHVLDYSRPALSNMCSIWLWPYEPNLIYDKASLYASTNVFCISSFYSMCLRQPHKRNDYKYFQTSWAHDFVCFLGLLLSKELFVIRFNDRSAVTEFHFVRFIMPSFFKVHRQ